MIELVLTLRAMRGILRTLTEAEHPERVVRYPLNLSHLHDGIEFLAHSGSLLDSDGTLVVWPITEEDASDLAMRTHSQLTERQWPRIELGIGIGSQQGRVAGLVRLDPNQEALPLDRIRIVGPQMPTLWLSEPCPTSFRSLWVTEEGLYSRLIGTLGLRTFARLQNARIAVIGAGGSGSLMAKQLANWMGCDGHLGLIDADRIEVYNLPAWGTCGGQDAAALVGKHKVEALADHLRTLPDAPQIEPVAASVLDWSALAALKGYDLFVSCVDNPAARYAATCLATLYLRPLLDVATGVFLGNNPAEHAAKITQEEAETEANNGLFRNGRLPYSLMESGPRAMGADIRLVIPGFGERSGNCLLCLGGVGSLEDVRNGFEAAQPRKTASPHHSSFWQGRAGSLSTLNGDAVNQGLRMLISFLEGSSSSSQHWQMDQSLSSPPVWRLVSSEQGECQLCRRAGYGDPGLNAVKEIISPGNQ